MVQTTNDLIGTTKDGYNVYDRFDSHIHTEGGITRELLKKALKRMYANGASFKKKQIHFTNPIGFTCCVPVTNEDEVVMVYRKGREGQTPMVKGREPLACNVLTIIIRKEKNYTNHYTLITSYIGEGSLREPWDKGIRTCEERKESEEYWKKHALIYDAELIDFDRM